ncbi:MAG: tripartite tricarboxylate transporter substrate binding protein [Betaproteobacteria bacterium]|nr:tripartite tricarboxylate transporter substrate binding protein [Betaproteobacteria bacterium]
MKSTLKLAACAMLGLGAIGASTLSAAQDAYPSKPIVIVLPFSPGGSGDKTIRVMAPFLEARLGQALVIDHKPGGANNIGTDYVVRARPDGYTLLMQGVPLAVNPSLYKKLNWTLDDLVPIALLSVSPYLIVVNNNVPAKSMKELIDLAKTKSLNYASAGVGSGAHMTGALINQVAKINMNHIPYKSGPQALIDLMGGTVDLFTSPIVSSVVLVEAGKVRPLAVTGLKRAPSLPNVPTVAESGLPGFEILGWYGVLAPKGTPPAVISKLNQAFASTLREPEVIKALGEEGNELRPGTSADFARFLQRETAISAEIVKAAGAKVE